MPVNIKPADLFEAIAMSQIAHMVRKLNLERQYDREKIFINTYNEVLENRSSIEKMQKFIDVFSMLCLIAGMIGLVISNLTLGKLILASFFTGLTMSILKGVAKKHLQWSVIYPILQAKYKEQCPI